MATSSFSLSDLNRTNATFIGSRAGVSFYEHPVNGDEAPLLAVLPDYSVVESPWWELPDSHEVVEWDAHNRKPRCGYYPPIGTVSHGTTNPDDLGPVFGDMLAAWVQNHPDCVDVNKKAELALLGRGVPDMRDEELRSQTVNDLFDALQEIAPPYCYFGALEGDGADYGFWPLHEQIHEDVGNGIITEVDALGAIPLNESGFYILNDTLYEVRDGSLIEVFRV